VETKFAGNFGLQALEPDWITSRQIEALDEQLRYTKRGQSYGLEFFQIKLLLLEQLNQEWVLVKVQLLGCCSKAWNNFI
jgi:hypothetical protein